MADNEDVLEIVRPDAYPDDREWALALTERLWIAEDRLFAAEGTVQQIKEAMEAWEAYLEEAPD